MFNKKPVITFLKLLLFIIQVLNFNHNSFLVATANTNEGSTTTNIVSVIHKITNNAAAGLNVQRYNTFICTTWIFPIIFLDEAEIWNNAFSTYFATTANILPVLLPSKTWPNIHMINSSRISANFSYRGYEFKDEDFFKSVAYGQTQRFGVNCATIGIQINSSANFESSAKVLELILDIMYKAKIARQHKDYFVFFIQRSVNISATINQLENLPLISELRYKYYLLENSDGALDLINNCEFSPSQKLPLFARTCDSLINGRFFRIASTNFPSMIRPDSSSFDRNSTRLQGGGFLYSMVKEAAARHNFTFKIALSGYNGATGMKKEINGKLIWVGAVGELLSGHVDISFASATTYDRHRVHDPTVLHTWYTRVFYLKPRYVRISWLAIFRPLGFEIWLIIFLTSFCALGPILTVVIKLHTIIHHNKPANQHFQPKSLIHILFDQLDLIFRIFIEQSSNLHNWIGITFRTLVILWAIVSVVLVTGYRAKLVTFLSFAANEIYPRTHLELAQSKDYQLYFRYYGGAVYKDYKSSRNQMHINILKKSVLVNSSIDCLQAVLTSRGDKPGICLDYLLSGDFTINSNFTLPQMGTSGNGLFIKSVDTDWKYVVSWTLRKGSRWTESFDRILLNFYAAGLYDLWVDNDWATTRKNGDWFKQQEEMGPAVGKDSSPTPSAASVIKQLWNEMKEKGPKALHMNNFKGLFLISIIGLSIAAASFVIEIFMMLIRNRNKAKEGVNNEYTFVNRKLSQITLNW